MNDGAMASPKAGAMAPPKTGARGVYTPLRPGCDWDGGKTREDHARSSLPACLVRPPPPPSTKRPNCNIKSIFPTGRNGLSALSQLEMSLITDIMNIGQSKANTTRGILRFSLLYWSNFCLEMWNKGIHILPSLRPGYQCPFILIIATLLTARTFRKSNAKDLPYHLITTVHCLART
ncbi:hypothetical protein AVEN_248298-1 [Araneus ventricosus]|uniref:Uncharacterized protein n=1 Tax=Araneus ventricosus TaxID=182803 RepID=A0A4Y2FH19_ARAVE|nr:hypothetical protein AVEN_248298-1 [Araneus ventricosus]